MRIHRGPLKNPVRLTTTTKGFTLVSDGAAEYVPHEAETVRRVRRLFGFSSRRWFFGLILYYSAE